jgi:phage-related tail fiber protein
MSNYNTGNPVPSIDPRDLDDNAAHFDDLLNTAVPSVLDRTGVARKTWWQIEQDALALVSPNISALAGLTLSANKGLYATGVGALATYDLTTLGRTLGGIANAAAGRAALTAAASGANGDITSLTGLTTALSVTQGGTGATTAGAARTALAAAASGANTDITSITGSAATLTTSRSISTTGDATWTVNFNGSANVTAAITLAASGVGAGTYGSVTVNAKGLVTSASAITPVANGGSGVSTSTGTGNNVLSDSPTLVTPTIGAAIADSLQRRAVVIKTVSFTVAANENWLFCNGSGSITVTLPSAASFPGREIMIKTVTAQTVVSASSNVAPLAGGVNGTAILAATAGKWATLVSDGSVWVIMQGN